MILNKLGTNETEIVTWKHMILFSYETPVAVKKGNVIYVTEEQYSRTTTKHIHRWICKLDLPQNIREIKVPQKKIKEMIGE